MVDWRGVFTAEALDSACAPEGVTYVVRAHARFSVMGQYLIWPWFGSWWVVVRRERDDPLGHPIYKAKMRNRIAALDAVSSICGDIRSGTFKSELPAASDDE